MENTFTFVEVKPIAKPTKTKVKLVGDKKVKVEPESFVLKALYCDYCGVGTTVEYEVNVCEDIMFGIMCCPEHQLNAIRDTFNYCKRERIYPIRSLCDKLSINDSNPNRFFNIKRSNGNIEDGWMINYQNYIRWSDEFNDFFVPLVSLTKELEKIISLKEFMELNHLEAELDYEQAHKIFSEGLEQFYSKKFLSL